LPSQISTEALANRYDMYEITNGDPNYLRASLRLSEEELSRLVTPEALFQTGAPSKSSREVEYTAFRRAIFDTHGQWDHLRVVALWADMSPWASTLSSKVIADMLASTPIDREARREVEMVYIEGANHIVSGLVCLGKAN
jgi:hypothetical protein